MEPWVVCEAKMVPMEPGVVVWECECAFIVSYNGTSLRTIPPDLKNNVVMRPICERYLMLWNAWYDGTGLRTVPNNSEMFVQYVMMAVHKFVMYVECNMYDCNVLWTYRLILKSSVMIYLSLLCWLIIISLLDKKCMHELCCW